MIQPWYNPLGHTATDKHNMASILTSSNRNIFRVAGLSWGQSTGHLQPHPPPPPLHTHIRTAHTTHTPHPKRTTNRPVTRSSDILCAWTNGWENNWDADDLRRHRAHYNVNAMTFLPSCVHFTNKGLLDLSIFSIVSFYVSRPRHVRQFPH